MKRKQKDGFCAIDCILCCADNAIDSRSVRNDDILVMKSGVTVEVNNTDAEGRLVLGDGVYHACTETGGAPDVVIDMATLTGAQGVATGLRHAAVLTASVQWEDKILAAGKKSGDLCFPILYCPEFNAPEYKSNVADVKNSVANRANSLASCAGYFIENNLPKDYKGAWLHIDMAYPVANDRGAVGFGVALIAEALELF